MLMMNILLKMMINTPAAEWQILRTSLTDVLLAFPNPSNVSLH